MLFIADEAAQFLPEHPVLVVDLADSRPPFGCIPAALWSVENNLNIANMDWEEFADHVSADGVFRGFDG